MMGDDNDETKWTAVLVADFDQHKWGIPLFKIVLLTKIFPFS